VWYLCRFTVFCTATIYRDISWPRRYWYRHVGIDDKYPGIVGIAQHYYWESESGTWIWTTLKIFTVQCVAYFWYRCNTEYRVSRYPRQYRYRRSNFRYRTTLVRTEYIARAPPRCDLSTDKHVLKLSSSCFYWLRRI